MIGGFSEDQFRRYARHIVLAEVGGKGQARLLASRVLVVGAGGLGSPAALYLAAAGVGTLGLCDDDVVDLSNLQRQILHGTKDVGRAKVESGRDAVARVNPDVHVRLHPLRITAANAAETIAGYDVVVDGSDNFDTKFLLNDVAVARGVPLVIGGILRFSGQVMTVLPRSACYRCVFEEAPPPGLAPACQEAGVLGAVAGVVGSLQAVEVVKVLLGCGAPYADRILVWDALPGGFREVAVSRRPGCPACNRAENLTVTRQVTS
jgi:molybdopterin-synthase adenylyltransferase